MKYLFLIIFWTTQIFSQNVITSDGEKINELDQNNNKIGFWKIVNNTKGIVISGQMSGDSFVSNINYYRYGKLIASQSKDGNLIIYKDSETINAKLFLGEKPYITKSNGDQLDAETSKMYFQTAGVNAMFYGGSEALRYALMKYIDLNKTKNHYGKVKVKIVIDDDGILESAEIIESDDAFLNEEALRVAKSLPRWQPGFQFGNFVKVTFTLPLNFGTKAN